MCILVNLSYIQQLYFSWRRKPTQIYLCTFSITLFAISLHAFQLCYCRIWEDHPKSHKVIWCPGHTPDFRLLVKVLEFIKEWFSKENVCKAHPNTAMILCACLWNASFVSNVKVYLLHPRILTCQVYSHFCYSYLKSTFLRYSSFIYLRNILTKLELFSFGKESGWIDYWDRSMFLFLMLLNNLYGKVSDKNQLHLGNYFLKWVFFFFFLMQLHCKKMPVLTHSVK